MPNKLLANRNSEPLRRTKVNKDEDKRKSEVLIAAQSLDLEIKNVKQLKRLSIGSMDLLIDPELEYTMKNDSPTNEGFTDDKRKSWSQAKFDMIKENEIIKKEVSMDSSLLSTSGIDIESEEEDSIDVTRAEYLHQEPNSSVSKDDKYIGSNLSASSSSSSLNTSSNTNNSNNTSSNGITSHSKLSSSHRKLSGAGFLRRGSNNIHRSTRKLSSRPTNLAHNNKSQEEINNDDEPFDEENLELTNQLLWVPASQHPNVKPENYLELVQDTLQHITLEDSSQHPHDNNLKQNTPIENTDDHITYNNNSNNNKRRSLDASLKRHSSVVRRPSMLRRSYTEFNNDFKEEEATDNDTTIDDSNISRSSVSMHNRSIVSRRSISLKDITEELTKISNSVGLTDNDAITLARTLSMTGSYTDLENDADDSDNVSNSTNNQILNNLDGNESDNENGFASNMFMKNGITIPTRSSLRRSKFNTYKIRGNSPDQSDRSISKSSNVSTETMNRRKQLPFIYSGKNNTQRTDSKITLQSPQVTQTNQDTTESPGSISDLYDHYRHSSGDWDIDSDLTQQKDARDDDSDLHTSQESSFNSHESSNDSVLYKPTQGQQFVTERFVDNNLNKRDSKERPWSWIDTESSSESLTNVTEEQASIEQLSNHEDHNVVDDDFVNLRVVTNKKSAEKINHSKNRHMPIFNLNLHSEKKEEVTVPEVVVSEPSKDITPTAPDIAVVSSSSSDVSPVSNGSGREFEKESLGQSSTSTTSTKESKKETLEEKFVKLFKRRHHHKNEESSTDKVTPNKTQEDLKKKISKFRSRNIKSSNHNNANKTSLLEQTFKQSVIEGKSSNNPEKIVTSNHQDVIQQMPETVTYIPESKDINLEDDEGAENLPSLQPAVSVTSSKQTSSMDRSVSKTSEDSDVVETVCELEGDESQELSNTDVQLQHQDMPTYIEDSAQASDEDDSFVDATANTTIEVLPPRKLTFADVKKPDRPNAPIQFTDSAFGFPLPMLTVSTVIMFDHRLGINVERAIYRLSHLKLSDPKRELRQQVLLSNFMYAYLNLVNHTLYMEQANANNIGNTNVEPTQTNGFDGNINNQGPMGTIDESSEMNSNSFGNAYTTEHNESNETILIPDIS